MNQTVSHVKALTDAPPPIAADTALEPYTFGNFTFTATGLVVNGKPDIDEWSAVGHMLAVQTRGLQFMVGDWIRYGETAYGELASQVIDARAWSDETVRNYLWVAKNVPLENRREDLTFKHHQIVAHLPKSSQRRWLKTAATEDASGIWPASRLDSAIKNGADAKPTLWYLIVGLTDEQQRDALRKRLESEGHTCKSGASWSDRSENR